MKISLPYRHYYYLKILADLRRERVSEAIRYLFKNFDEHSEGWIDTRFAHFNRPPMEFAVDDDLLKVNTDSLMKRLEALPSGIKPKTDGPYETNVTFFDEGNIQAIGILGYKIFDFKSNINEWKMRRIYSLVKDKFPFEMTLAQYEIYRLVGSQFWGLTQDRKNWTMPNPGETAMDVGAYIGLRALAAHYCVGPKGKVYAIEVEDENFELLKKNAEVNNLDNFIPIQEAVDSTARTTILYTRNERSMSHGLRPFESIEDPSMLVANNSRFTKEVATLPLDDIFKKYKINSVDNVHISVAGHEIEVLKGINNILPQLETVRVSCPYKTNGIPNIETAQEILEKKGFKNLHRHGSALIGTLREQSQEIAECA